MTTPILLLGDAHGETEAQFGAPLIGASGIELIRMLSESGLLTLSPVDRDLLSHYYRTSNPKHLISLWAQHPEIARTNVFNRQPPGNDLAHFLGAKSDGIPGYPLLKLPTTRYKPNSPPSLTASATRSSPTTRTSSSASATSRSGPSPARPALAVSAAPPSSPP